MLPPMIGAAVILDRTIKSDTNQMQLALLLVQLMVNSLTTYPASFTAFDCAFNCALILLLNLCYFVTAFTYKFDGFALVGSTRTRFCGTHGPERSGILNAMRTPLETKDKT